MALWLFRHGPARSAEDWAPRKEDLRPLTDRGFRVVRKVGRRLARHGLRPRLILHSPLTRSSQTADLLAEVLAPLEGLAVCEALRPEVPAIEALKTLTPFLKDRTLVMAVGHQPALSRLASLLLTGDPEGAAIHLGKGGWCLLHKDRWDVEGRATLIALEHPDLSRKIGWEPQR